MEQFERLAVCGLVRCPVYLYLDTFDVYYKQTSFQSVSTLIFVLSFPKEHVSYELYPYVISGAREREIYYSWLSFV